MSEKNIQILSGTEAAALAAKLCKVEVVAAYPITPQSKIPEKLSEYVEKGELKAEFVLVESEHSALGVCISASLAGARAFTATCANGLLYMSEQVHWAAGSRVPVVMCVANRGVGAPWTILNDQQDTISQRDAGWIQLYCRNNQEILDTVIQAFIIAEELFVPIMVCFDGFVLSHTNMPVEVPDSDDIASIIPPYKPVLDITDSKHIVNINPVTFSTPRPSANGEIQPSYMGLRKRLNEALILALTTIPRVDALFEKKFNRRTGGLLWEYMVEDAEVILLSMGSLTSETEVAADALRQNNIKAGVIGVRCYRPFPGEAIRKALQHADYVAVFEKDISYGHEGALCSDIKSALYDAPNQPKVMGFIAGLGGKDVKARELQQATIGLIEGRITESPVWINLTV